MLEDQAREFKPGLVAVFDDNGERELRTRLRDTDIKVVSGMDGLIEAAACQEADTVITAVVGMIGLRPTLAAIDAGKDIALANKETLVCAGEIVMGAAAEKKVKILPVDSEHSANFQCLQGQLNRSISSGVNSEIKRILLTASGGPFRGKTYDELASVTKEMALRHPNWSMGPKITIDSATMMNKGLEFIEAMHLFSVTPAQIKVLVHPQSVVHSMVEFSDNSVIAQMGPADMRLPIQYALTYPERREHIVDSVDFTKFQSLTFFEPDLDAFRCLDLAMKTAERGGTSCAVMNGANEEAVGLFLQDKITFNQIYEFVAKAVDIIDNVQEPSLEDVLEADRQARDIVKSFM